MRGFTLIELLVAMCIMLLITAAALSLVGPVRDAFQVQPESSDQQQRIRIGVDALHRDLLMAGAGMYAAGSVGALHQAFAPVMPYKAFGSSSDAATGTRFRPDAISLVFVPSTPAQTRLAAAMEAGSLAIDLEDEAVCPRSTSAQVCGFGAGDQVLVFDRGGEWDVFTVDRVEGDARLILTGLAPSRSFAAGANLVRATAVTHALKEDPASGAFQLVRANAFDPAQPVLDHVVKLEFRYFGGPDPADELTPALLADGPWRPDEGARNRFDADLLRIRRVRFTIRVQTAVASLRGPAGTLFTNGGLARAGGRYVPDMEIQLDVTPRNLNLDR